MVLDPGLLLLFLPFVILIVVTPGPDTFMVLSSSLSKGRCAGLYCTLGVGLGTAIYIGAVALGVAAIFATSLLAFNVVKFVGAVYLVHLGVKTLRSKGARVDAPVATGPKGAFWQGLISNTTNVKIAIFYLTTLPQFANPRLGHIGLQIAVLGLIELTFACLWLALLAIAASRARHLVTGSERFALWRDRIAGVAFIGFGLKLALAKQKA